MLRRKPSKRFIAAVPSVFFLLLSIFGFSSPVQAVSDCDTAYSASNFTLGGVASDSSGTVTLTPNAGGQFGAIWNKSRVDLSSDFCVIADVYLGNNDGGADGLAFVMQPNSVAAGGSGGGLGYMGITPSFAVEYDTWPNGGDLYNDHVGLMKNGNVVSHNLWGVNAVDVGDIEDGLWHKSKIYWDSVDNEVSVWLDKNADGDTDDSGETLFDAVSADLEANFSGEVYWGFTAATGGATNLQQVRNITYTGVARTNAPPTASTAPVLNGSVVINQATVIPFVVADDETTQAQWSFTKTSSDTTVVPLNAISISMSSATEGTISITPATAGSSTVVIGIQDADGSALSYTLSVTATPPSLQVTSLLDDGSSGTLRWAINQANATAGGIYDAISIATQGTITLTSDLPAITAGVTITGTGMATTIIDGNNLWRAIYNNGSRTIVIEDMTFKQGKNVSWNGGLIYNGSGTMTFNRIKISNHSSWAFYQGGGGVTTFNDSQFNNNGYAITSDHGSTPSSLSLTDTNYSNRIYINNSVFTSNTYGIRTERFVKINNSQFTGNTQFGAYLGGLNRQQVTNSSFTSNGTGVYFSSWIPTSWTPGAGNQTVSGNTFNGNTTAIQFANNWNNGSSVYNGVSANSFSTSTGNTFGATAVNTANYSGTGYVANGDTIVAPYFNAVQNLTATANNDGSVFLDWDVPASSNTAPYMYNILFYDLVNGQETSGWGVWTYAANTSYTLGSGMWAGTTGYGPVRFKIQAGTAPCVGEANGLCLYGPQATADATVIDPTTVTTTTSSTTTSTTTTTTTIYVPPVDSGGSEEDDSSPTGTTAPLPQYPEPETESTTVTLPEETEPETELPTETIPEYSEPIETEPIETEPVEVDNPWSDSTGTPEEFDELPADATPKEIGAVIEEVDFTEISDSDFDNTIDAVFESIENPEDVADVIGSFLEADISDEQFEAVLDKVFEDISDTTETVEVLTNLFDGPLSDEELDSVMEAVFSEDATVDQMSAVVTDLLDKDLDVEELDAVFEAAFDGDLSDKETIDLIVDVLAEDLTSEALGSALGAVFDEEVSNEVLVETFTAVLGNELDGDSVEVIVDVLESDSISGEQVSTVVSLIIEQEGGVDSEQATELATSPKVLESISGEQATDVFDAVNVAEVSQEEGTEIVEALEGAPEEVKESFEEEINVFAGVFDTYVALGSNIDVGDRRTVLAVGAATTALAAAAGAGMNPVGGGGGSRLPEPTGGSGALPEARKREEEEPSGEISGDGLDWVSQISIYKYKDGVRVMDWKAFFRKFSYGIMNMGFTIAGSLVVYLTLSGSIQKIAGISTLLALGAALWVHMKEPNND